LSCEKYNGVVANNCCVAVAMPGLTQRGQVKGGVLQEWRVGSVNLKEDRVLLRTLGLIDVQKKAFATLIKVGKLTVFIVLRLFVAGPFTCNELFIRTMAIVSGTKDLWIKVRKVHKINFVVFFTSVVTSDI